MNYDMTKITETLIDWMKEANCYDPDVRKPISFSILNNDNIEIVSGDAGKMIGRKGALAHKYTKLFAKIIGKQTLDIKLVCPSLLITIGSSGDDVILYYNQNT
jgi:ribosomal protein S3